MSSPNKQSFVEDIVSAFETTQNQPWSMFSDKLNNVSNKDSEKKDPAKSVNTISLSSDDIPVFGLVPRLDKVMLVSCNECAMIVKRDCLHSHYYRRHNSSSVGHSEADKFSLVNFLSTVKTNKNKKLKMTVRKPPDKKINEREKVSTVVKEIKTEFDEIEYERLLETNRAKIKQEKITDYDDQHDVDMVTTSCNPSTSSGVFDWDVKPCIKSLALDHCTDHKVNDKTIEHDKDSEILSTVSLSTKENLQNSKYLDIQNVEPPVNYVTTSSKLLKPDPIKRKKPKITIDFSGFMNSVGDEYPKKYRNYKNKYKKLPHRVKNLKEETNLTTKNNYYSDIINNKNYEDSLTLYNQSSNTSAVDVRTEYYNLISGLQNDCEQTKHLDVKNEMPGDSAFSYQSTELPKIKEEFQIIPNNMYPEVKIKEEYDENNDKCEVEEFYQPPTKLTKYSSDNYHSEVISNTYVDSNLSSIFPCSVDSIKEETTFTERSENIIMNNESSDVTLISNNQTSIALLDIKEESKSSLITDLINNEESKSSLTTDDINEVSKPSLITVNTNEESKSSINTVNTNEESKSSPNTDNINEVSKPSLITINTNEESKSSSNIDFINEKSKYPLITDYIYDHSYTEYYQLYTDSIPRLSPIYKYSDDEVNLQGEENLSDELNLQVENDSNVALNLKVEEDLNVELDLQSEDHLNNDLNLQGEDHFNDELNLQNDDSLSDDNLSDELLLQIKEDFNNELNLQEDKDFNDEINLQGDQDLNDEINMQGDQYLNDEINFQGDEGLIDEIDLLAEDDLSDDNNWQSEEDLDDEQNFQGKEDLNVELNLQSEDELSTEFDYQDEDDLSDEHNLQSEDNLDDVITFQEKQILLRSILDDVGNLSDVENLSNEEDLSSVEDNTSDGEDLNHDEENLSDKENLCNDDVDETNDNSKYNCLIPPQSPNNEEETKHIPSKECSVIINNENSNVAFTGHDQSPTEILGNEEESKTNSTLFYSGYLTFGNDVVVDNFENEYYQFLPVLDDKEAQTSFAPSYKYSGVISNESSENSDESVSSYDQSSVESLDVSDKTDYSSTDTSSDYTSDENVYDSESTSSSSNESTILCDDTKKPKYTQTNLLEEHEEFMNCIAKFTKSFGLVDGKNNCTQTDVPLECMKCYISSDDYIDRHRTQIDENSVPINSNVQIDEYCVNNFTPISSSAQIINNTIIPMDVKENELKDSIDCDFNDSNKSHYLSHFHTNPCNPASQNNNLMYSPINENNCKIYNSELNAYKPNEYILHSNTINETIPFINKNNEMYKELIRFVDKNGVNDRKCKIMPFERIAKNLKKNLKRQVADNKENRNHLISRGFKKIRMEFIDRDYSCSDESDNNDNVDD